MVTRIDKNAIRAKRHYRQRRYINGTAERPRLNVYRSTNHIYAQIIDDEANGKTGNTLVAASTTEGELQAELSEKTKTEAAELIGQLIGKRALEKGITKVVFDRGGYLYTGRVQALADGARKAGLDF